MATFYLSSTYADLIDERRAVGEAIWRLGHRVVSMESSAVSDVHPLYRAMRDVRDCDVYVVLCAHRYGHVPEGLTRSITELEYDEAVKHAKPRLVFMLEEDAEPSIETRDEDREAIEAFRDRLLSDNIVDFFRNMDDLIVKVTVAISRLSLEDPERSPRHGDERLGDRRFHAYVVSDPADRDLARAWRRALERFALPLFGRPPVRIARVGWIVALSSVMAQMFRILFLIPRTVTARVLVSTAKSAWRRTVQRAAREGSDHLVLFIPPGAAGSPVVREEVVAWMEEGRDPNRVVIIRARGPRDEEHFGGDLAEMMRPFFTGENRGPGPQYVEVELAGASDLARHPERYRESVATVAAHLLGRPRDELLELDERVRAARRRMVAYVAPPAILLGAVLAILGVIRLGWSTSRLVGLYLLATAIPSLVAWRRPPPSFEPGPEPAPTPTPPPKAEAPPEPRRQLDASTIAPAHPAPSHAAEG